MKILMVCLGNICRSPIADGVLRKKVKDLNLTWEIDSAGTAAYHIGEKPDERMQKTALKNGFDISNLRARQFQQKDFDEFDIIYAMDASNYNNIIALAKNETQKNKVKLFLNELNPNSNQAVPDPYYGGQDDFDLVFNLVDETTNIILEKYNS